MVKKENISAVVGCLSGYYEIGNQQAYCFEEENVVSMPQFSGDGSEFIPSDGFCFLKKKGFLHPANKQSLFLFHPPFFRGLHLYQPSDCTLRWYIRGKICVRAYRFLSPYLPSPAINRETNDFWLFNTHYEKHSSLFCKGRYTLLSPCIQVIRMIYAGQ